MREFIPGVGEKSTKERFRKLEEKAGTLPVIFALLFTEAIKILVGGVPVPFLEAMEGYQFILDALKFFLLSIVVAVAYIYEAKRREVIGFAKEKAQEKTESVKEQTDKVKEQASGNADKPSYQIELKLFGKSYKFALDTQKDNK